MINNISFNKPIKLGIINNNKINNNKINNRIRYPQVIYILLIIIIAVCFTYLIKFYNIYLKEIDEKTKINKLKISYQEFGLLNDDSINPDDVNLDNSHLYNNIITGYRKDSFTNTNNKVNEENGGLEQDKIDESLDCIIEIPEIELSKAVYTGNDREDHLSDYELVTASPDMLYVNGGNYIICGHASRLYGHSLNRLKEVHKGTLIRIWAKYGVDEYEVKKVYFDNMDNTSDYCKQTDANEITIVSCAKYISVNSYIIVKAIKK